MSRPGISLILLIAVASILLIGQAFSNPTFNHSSVKPTISLLPALYAEPPHPITVINPTTEATRAIESAAGLTHIFLPIIMSAGTTLDDKPQKWHPFTLSFSGPYAAETNDNPNPFLDYRLQVHFTGPGGQEYNVPGYFAGDGKGNGYGNIWQVRFAPDEAGQWHYQASFRSGLHIAISLDPNSGTPVSFDGASGNFTVADLDPHAPGFLKWGRLEYVGAHYLKFHDGPYWIKGGTNSPENFLGYKGFDNTVDQGGIVENFLHEFSPHVQDWNPADPNFVSSDTGYDAKGIIGALNYLHEKHVNSIYFLPMNLGGDGQETYPFIGASGSDFDNTHYDISKLYQWNIVLDHAQRQGIALHIVLNETETANRQWLDNGELGVQRMLFYRELVARYGYILALKWNLSEESVFSVPHLYEFASYIRALDWSQHPIAVHTLSNNFDTYTQIIGAPHFTATSVQYNAELAGNYVETWRAISDAAAQPWVIDMDENNPAATGLTNTNAGDLRKRVLYDVYFSGGNIEWYAGYHDLPLGGDMRLEDFRTREAMWQYMWYARRLMEDFLPFWAMVPADSLLVGEAEDYGGGEVFVKQNEIYAIYLPKASPSGMLTVAKEPGCFELRWYNPRTGNFEKEQTITTDEGVLALGEPPSAPLGDWVLIVKVCQSTLVSD